MAGLLNRYSNFVPRPISLKRSQACNSKAFAQVSVDIIDTSYDLNRIVTEIRQQQQKDLTDNEIRQITRRYSEGASVHEFARDFACHRSTVSRYLRRQGITVSNKVTDRPALVERVLQMHSDGMHAIDIAALIGITKSVSKILHDNDVRIRHSTEYSAC